MKYCKYVKKFREACSLLIFKVEAERRATEEEENKASEEYIQRLLAEDEEEEKRQAAQRRSEMEEQLKNDEELARKLSINIVSFWVVLGFELRTSCLLGKPSTT
jgi:hypothetical protein